MDNVNISENSEASIVLGETIIAVVTGYVTALPIPLEIKLPTITLTSGIAVAIFGYWKTKVNKQIPKQT